MKKNLFLGSLFSLLLLATALLTTKSVFAQQQGLNLTVSPTLMDLSVDPGSKTTEKFRIRNNGSTPLTLHIQVDKLNPDSNTGQVLPINPQPGDTSTTWLQFDKNSFIANPGEWTDISFTLNIPNDAAFGYYYALRIGQESNDVKTNANAKVLGEVILPVLVDVKKDGAKADIQLVDFKTSDFLSEYLPVTFETTVKNSGNVHVKPHGNIFITGAGDKNLAILDINQGLGNVLPGGSRIFESSWNEGFLVREPVVEDGVAKLASDGTPETHLVINWNKLTDLRIGKYTAHMLLVYDNGQRDVPIEATTTFWVFPWKFVLGMVAGIILFIILIRMWLTWYIKQQVKRYKNS